jgi:hypothetical protein
MLSGLFGPRISNTNVVHHLGIWRATIYLDEQKLTELTFEIVR